MKPSWLAQIDVTVLMIRVFEIKKKIISVRPASTEAWNCQLAELQFAAQGHRCGLQDKLWNTLIRHGYVSRKVSKWNSYKQSKVRWRPTYGDFGWIWWLVHVGPTWAGLVAVEFPCYLYVLRHLQRLTWRDDGVQSDQVGFLMFVFCLGVVVSFFKFCLGLMLSLIFTRAHVAMSTAVDCCARRETKNPDWSFLLFGVHQEQPKDWNHTSRKFESFMAPGFEILWEEINIVSLLRSTCCLFVSCMSLDSCRDGSSTSCQDLSSLLVVFVDSC